MIAGLAGRLLSVDGRKVVAGVALAASALTGAGFLTAAGWTALDGQFGPVTASAAIGAAYLVPLALVVLVRAVRCLLGRQKHPAPSEPTVEQMMVSFALGAQLGERLAGRR